MKTQLLTLCAIAVTGLTVSACSTATSRPTDLAPGKYEKTTRSTDAYGTETTRKSSTNVDVDSSGNKSAVVKTETTKDPEGLFNKTTTSKTQSTYEEDR